MRPAGPERRATFDPLTGVLKRRALEERLDAMLEVRGDVRPPIGVLMAEIDGYEGIADFYGDGVAAEVLAETGRRLDTQLRAGDLCGRCAGEEFVVVLVGGDWADHTAVASRIATSMRQSMATSAGPLSITVSIGWVPIKGQITAHEAVRQAYGAMTAAATTGGGVISGGQVATAGI